jgi:hypothetical protein
LQVYGQIVKESLNYFFFNKNRQNTSILGNLDILQF